MEKEEEYDRTKVSDEEPSDPQRRKAQELGGKSPAHCTGLPRGTRPILGKVCVKRKRPLGFLIRKKPKIGEEKNMT